MPLFARHAWLVIQKVRLEYKSGVKKNNQANDISIWESKEKEREDMHWMGLFVGWARASKTHSRTTSDAV